MNARVPLLTAQIVLLSLLSTGRSAAFVAVVALGSVLLASRFVATRWFLRRPLRSEARRALALLWMFGLWGLLLWALLLRGVEPVLLLPAGIMAFLWFILDEEPSTASNMLLAGLVTLTGLIVGASSLLPAAVEITSFSLVAGLVLLALTWSSRSEQARRARVVHTATRRTWSVPKIAFLAAISGAITFWMPLRDRSAEGSPNDDGSMARQALERVTGFTTSVRLGQLGDIKKSDAVALEIIAETLGDGGGVWTLDGGAAFEVEPLWRGAIYTEFDGVSWRAAERGGHEPRLSRLPRREWEQRVRQSIRAAPRTSEHLFALAPVATVSSGCELDGYGGVRTVDVDSDTVNYQVESRVLTRSARDSIGERRALHPNPDYSSTAGISTPVRDLAREWAKETRTDLDRVEIIEQELRSGNFRYTLEDVNAGQAPIETFLFKTLAGHCEYFASAMVLCLRSLGIPSRLAGGYRGGTYSERFRMIRVQERNAHAWVEVYFEELGWIAFDPTPAESELDAAQDGRSGVDEAGGGLAPKRRSSQASGFQASRNPWSLMLGGLSVLLGCGVSWWAYRRFLKRTSVFPQRVAMTESLAQRIRSVLADHGAASSAALTLWELLERARFESRELEATVRRGISVIYQSSFGGDCTLRPEMIEISKNLRTAMRSRRRAPR